MGSDFVHLSSILTDSSLMLSGNKYLLIINSHNGGILITVLYTDDQGL